MSTSLNCTGGEISFVLGLGYFDCEDRAGNDVSQIRISVGAHAGGAGYTKHHIEVVDANDFDIEADAVVGFGAKASTRGSIPLSDPRPKIWGLQGGVQATWTITMGLPQPGGGIKRR